MFTPVEVKYNMQVNSIKNCDYTNKHNTLNNKVSFEGFGIKLFKSEPIRSDRVQKAVDEACRRYGNIIGVRTSELQELTKDASDVKMQFLKSLVTKYNARNFKKEWHSKEDPKGLLDIFKNVENPEVSHFNIVRRADTPLESLSNLFKIATDKDSLEFIQTMQHKILGGTKTAMKIITDLLTSKNKQEYIKNTENYIAYLKQNISNENAGKELDRMLENGTFDGKIYEAKQAIKSLMRNNVIKNTLEPKTKYLEQNYSKEGERFIKGIFSDFQAHRKDLTPADFSDILKMYKSSTSENIDTRLEILKKFKFTTLGKKSEKAVEEIQSMKKLFDRMDSDKSSANFVYKILGDDIKAKSIKDIVGVLDVVPSKKAEIFHKNIARIVKFTDEEERVAALTKEVENPFFMTDKYAKLLQESIDAGYAKKESRISKIARFFENKFNIMKYHRLENSQIQSQGQEITTTRPIVRTPKLSTVTVKAETPAILFKRTFKESPQARKLRVQNDVNEIIKQKLGAKTLERQKEDFKNGALVMRLKLLPEIFNSIKDTRKMQKLYDKRPNVENADAIKLYSRINGKNRKLVNYMLKQRDSIGWNRIYDIKDILKRLDLVERKIEITKETKGKDFCSQDVKNIFQHEYEIVIAQYGKLRRTKKSA